VAFAGVNVLDGRSDARAFIRKFEVSYPNAWDRQGVFREFRVAGIPETLFVARDGRIVGRWIGAIDEANLRRLLSDLRELKRGDLLRIDGRGPQVGVR
jgi:cytochrome c biogenesis protein CcmG/thiol:disulfide interchange protein DsbE